MMMRVNVEHGQRTALSVPESAVQYEGDQAFVFVITAREKGNVARKVLVTPGVNENGFVEIREGVKLGDKVVADGLNRLQDGQQVRLPGQRGPEGKGGPGAKGKN
jgi:membrane fusion protein (multidrug efflux system)